MAVVWAVSNLKRDSAGSVRLHTGTLTATGTYTTAGDDVLATTLGLHTIRSFVNTEAENATPLVFALRPVVASDQSKVTIQAFGTNAAPGAAVADVQVTAGTTLTGYAFDFQAFGT